MSDDGDIDEKFPAATELPDYRQKGVVIRHCTVHFEKYDDGTDYGGPYEGTIVLLPNGYVDLRLPDVGQLVPPHRINTIDYGAEL